MRIEIDSVHSFRQLGQRDNQEDSRYPDMDMPDAANTVFAVCDGVGGSRKGEVASATVCKAIGKCAKTHDPAKTLTDKKFGEMLSSCYDALDSASAPDNRGMGTTLTFLALHKGGCFAAHIGDSRIYQIRPGDGILFRSDDHSLVKALVRSGNISPKDAEHHPQGNVITRCMSADDGVRDRDDASAVNISDVAPGDYFLLCSDGVTGCVDEATLVETLSSADSDRRKIDRLAAMSSRSSDNNTAILIHIGNVTVDPAIVARNEEAYHGSNTVKLPRGEENPSYEIAPKKNGKTTLKKLFKKLFK